MAQAVCGQELRFVAVAQERMTIMTLRTLIAFAGMAVLAACATSTYYEPASSDDTYGYSEQKIEDNRFRIMFKGNSLTERETVENFLLYRAAEVTVEEGYDYFVVVREDTEKETRVSRIGGDPYFYGRGRPFPYYGWGYAWDPFYDSRVDYVERNRYTAMAYIVLGKGEKPADETTAYDARQVLNNLSSSILRPTSG